MILVDSTFLIDLLRDQRTAVEKLALLELEDLATTEINVFEIMVGVYSSKKIDTTKDLKKALELIATLIVLPLDRKSSLKAAEIAGNLKKTGQKIGDLDCLSAGIALSNGITKIITENKSHFGRIPGIKVLGY